MTESNKKQSAEALLPEMEIFSVPPTQKSVERSYEVQYRPVSSLESSQVIDFVIPTSKDEYLLLHETYLYLRIEVQLGKKSGKDAGITQEDWNSIIPANNLLHSMIKQVELEIGGKEVTMANSTYAYRAYLETMLGFSSDSKQSHLASALWVDDEQERRSYLIPDDKTSATSKEVDLFGRLHLDLTFQGKAILGGKDVKIKILTHDPSFYMRSEPGSANKSFKIIMKDASIYAHKMKAVPALVAAHSKALNIAPARYPIARVDLRQVSIPAGSMDTMIDNVITGKLPRRLFLFMVPNSVLNGLGEKDPFKFQHYDVNHVACYIDGVQFPTNAYQPDFEKGLYVREFSGLFQTMNMNSIDTTINIKRNEYGNGKTVFGFNFAPDLSQGPGMTGHVNPIKRGGLRIHLRFAKTLVEVITVFLYCEFDNIIEIDAERNVTTDFK